MTKYTKNKLLKLCNNKKSILKIALDYEKKTGKKLRIVFTHTNRLGEKFLFGDFWGKDKNDDIILTLGVWERCIGNYIPVW